MILAGTQIPPFGGKDLPCDNGKLFGKSSLKIGKMSFKDSNAAFPLAANASVGNDVARRDPELSFFYTVTAPHSQ